MNNKSGKSVFVGFIVVAAIVIVAFLCFYALHEENTNDKQIVYALLPLTGASSELGNNIKQSMELYFQLHKNSQIALEYVDSGSSPEKAATAIRQKITNDERPIVISVLSSVSAAVIPIVNSMGGFTFAILTLQVNKTPTNDNYLRFDVTVDDVVLPNVEYMVRHGIVSATILYTNDEYGLSTCHKYKSELEKQNIEVVDAIPFSLTDTNVREVVAKMNSRDTDATIVCGNATPSYINVFHELSLQGFKGAIFADLGFQNPFVYKFVGDVCQRVVFSCPKAVLTEKEGLGAAFQKECEARNIPCNQTTVPPYDVLALIESMLVTGGRFEEETFVEMKQYNGLTDCIRFIGDGECAYDCFPAKIVGSKFEIVPAGE